MKQFKNWAEAHKARYFLAPGYNKHIVHVYADGTIQKIPYNTLRQLNEAVAYSATFKHRTELREETRQLEEVRIKKMEDFINGQK